ncbi:hypothetical protein NPX13_g7366 [Xylaria arbuscula]|uniref:Uncharacterized protein n=1 Tax=Xylaria arbuscula TaxID=114810 RepID=A0A9W8TKH9_9PEZI|nr:hypothetical protein NPX13_g7366 [Xylaria arbuscula]
MSQRIPFLNPLAAAFYPKGPATGQKSTGKGPPAAQPFVPASGSAQHSTAEPSCMNIGPERPEPKAAPPEPSPQEVAVCTAD